MVTPQSVEVAKLRIWRRVVSVVAVVRTVSLEQRVFVQNVFDLRQDLGDRGGEGVLFFGQYGEEFCLHLVLKQAWVGEHLLVLHTKIENN